MRTKNKIKAVLLGFIALAPSYLLAQNAGVTIVGLSGTNMTVAATTVYVPPAAYLNSTGNIYVGAANIIAGNTATLTGTSGARLHILAESQINSTVAAASTNVDVNGALVDVDIMNDNSQNIVLSDLAFGAIPTNANANLTVLRNFSFSTNNPFNGSAIVNNDLVTGSNKFIIGAAATLTGFDAQRYVVTNDNAGELRKLGLTTGQNFFFPVGRAESDYSPARLQVQSGGTVDYFVNVRNFAESDADETIGNYNNLPNVSRTWLVYGSNANTVANMDFIHQGTPTYEVNGYNRNNSNVIRYNTDGWVPNLPNDQEDQSVFGTPANYWAQQITLAVGTVPGLDTYFGKSNSIVVLPLRLGTFTASALGCDIQLRWNTLSEQNLSFFGIERSNNGNTGWQPINRVNAVGNSSTTQQYSFVDRTLTGAEAFYRLAITDRDGTVVYSPVVFGKTDCGSRIVAYPNPVTDVYNIALPVDGRTFNIRIINSAGQVVAALQRNTGLTRVNTNLFAAGYYVAVITDNTGASTSMTFIKR